MNKSDSIKNLAAALIKAQSAMGSAKKDSDNPFFKSKYADLAEVISVVKEPLLKNNITFLQIVTDEGVETTLIHESGEFISGTTPIKLIPEYRKDKAGNILVDLGTYESPQALGSAITYARRYGLQAMLGIPAEDDDGEKAMGRTSAPKSQIRPNTVPGLGF